MCFIRSVRALQRGGWIRRSLCLQAISAGSVLLLHPSLSLSPRSVVVAVEEKAVDEDRITLNADEVGHGRLNN